MKQIESASVTATDQMTWGVADRDLPNISVAPEGENAFVARVGTDRIVLSRLSAMILVKQLEHALNRSRAIKRSWFWKMRRKRLISKIDDLKEHMTALRCDLRRTEYVYDRDGKKMEFAVLEHRLAVAVRNLTEMEME